MKFDDWKWENMIADLATSKNQLFPIILIFLNFKEELLKKNYYKKKLQIIINENITNSTLN